MSTPNPLIPQGSLQSSGNSNVRIAVATIVAIHVVFFGGLLLQGCKRDTKTPVAEETNTVETNAQSAALTYPPIDSNSLYYRAPSNLPSAVPPTSDVNTSALAGAQSESPLLAPATTSSSPDPWKQLGPAGGANSSSLMTPSAPVQGKEHTVVRGDTFSELAKANGTTVAAIKRANPGVEPTKIRPGMKITIPGPETAGAAASGSAEPELSGNIYVVKSGDTLTKIARTHGVTIGQIREANNLRTSRINVNQKLKIPSSEKKSTAVASPTPSF